MCLLSNRINLKENIYLKNWIWNTSVVYENNIACCLRVNTKLETWHNVRKIPIKWKSFMKHWPGKLCNHRWQETRKTNAEKKVQVGKAEWSMCVWQEVSCYPLDCLQEKWYYIDALRPKPRNNESRGQPTVKRCLVIKGKIKQ